MRTSDVFQLNGINMPVPDKDGITISYEPLWSSNSGRTASGLYVGDIIDEKITVDISFSNLSDSEVKLIESQLTSAYYTASVIDPRDSTKRITIQCYRPPRSYPMKVIHKEGAVFNTVTLNCIER